MSTPKHSRQYHTFRHISLALLVLFFQVSGQFALGAESSPKEVYTEYLAKNKTATSVKNVSDFFSESTQKSIAKLSDKDAAQSWQMQHFFEPDEVSVVSETIEGPKATVKVRGKFTNVAQRIKEAKASDDPAKAQNYLLPTEGQVVGGTISMVLENGVWKIDATNWETVQMSTKKALTAKGEAAAQSDSARQSVTKFVSGMLYDKRFGLVKAQYSDKAILLDGGEIPTNFVNKFRAKVVIDFSQPQNFPGQSYQFAANQQTCATKSGTVKAPAIIFYEMQGETYTGSRVANSGPAPDTYTMALSLYKLNASGQLPGYIDLTVPNKKNSHVKGYFYATRTDKIPAY